MSSAYPKQSVAAVDPVPDMAEKLLDEADGQDELGRPFNQAVSAALRSMAELCRERHIETAEEYLALYPEGYPKFE